MFAHTHLQFNAVHVDNRNGGGQEVMKEKKDLF